MGIVKTEEVLGGEPRIEGRRISVYQVGDMVEEGCSPGDVAAQLDISLGEVYEALAYFYSHLDEMARIEEEYRELEKELKEVSRAPGKVQH